jgi:hypothetical protein
LPSVVNALVRSIFCVHRIPPRVNDDGQRPSVRRDGARYRIDFCFGKAEYFFKRDWTTQITLIWLKKLDFARTPSERAGKASSQDEAGGSARRAAREAGHATRCL